MEPKHTPIQSAVIKSGLDAKLFLTYAHLIMLAWKHDFKVTDWLGQADLEQLIGLDWSTIKRHTAELKRAGLIDWNTDKKNGRRFSILEVRLAKGAKAQYCAPSSSGSSSNPENETNLPLLQPAKAQNCALAPTDSCRGTANAVPMNAMPSLDPDAWQALRTAGIGEPIRTDLSNQPNVTAHYVRAMSAQAKREGVSIGALIYRIEHDWPEPDLCDECNGLNGNHSLRCSRAGSKYADDDAQNDGPAPASVPVTPVPVLSPIMSEEMQQAAQIWHTALSQLQLQLTSATYDTWLRRTRLISANGDDVYMIGVHNGYAKDWLENRMLSMIKRTLAEIVGRPIGVRFVILNEEQQPA